MARKTWSTEVILDADLNGTFTWAAWETNTGRPSVKAMTAAALAANTMAGNVITITANGALAAVDGQTINLNDRIWVNNEADTTKHGPYYLSQQGDGSTQAKLTRVEDFDADAEFLSGTLFYVRAGTANGGKYFYVPLATQTGTINVDAATAARLAAALGLLSTDLSDFAEAVQDVLGAAIVDSSDLDWTYNDGAGTTAATIINNAVTDAKLRDSAALSVIGRSANSSGDPADIAAGSDGDVLRRSGTTLGFGAIPESSVTNLTTDLAAKAPLASPTFTGNPAAPTAAVGTSTTQLATTAYVMAQEALLAASVTSGTVQTTDATVTTLLSLTPTDSKATQYMIQVAADKSDHSQAAGYALCATFRRNGGTVTQVGSTTNLSTHEDDAAWDCALDISGTSVRVRITGVAATTINWKAYAQARENS